ncbi:MAG: NTP transferase domain-containing protein [Patescibacteria group bacterium]|nr:NTP transferase domain-containing protein [Patescibacteria group bacterium]
MKILGFITVRVNSSRLPRKTLLSIRGKRVIEHVIERAKQIKGLDGVVVCTSISPEDDVLEQIAEEQGVLCFRGSLEDKLERYNGAIDRFGAELVFLIDADDPFFDPEIYELAIEQMRAGSADIIKSSPGLVPGAFAFGLRAAAIKEACAIKDTTDTEMYEVYFLETGRFVVEDVKVEDPIYFNDQARLTIDYQEDFDFFKRVFDGLEMDTNTVPLKKIMELLTAKPEITSINIHRHADYLAKREKMRQTKKLKSI